MVNNLGNDKRSLAPDLGRGFMLLLIVIAHAPMYLYTAEPAIFSRPFGENLMDDLVNFFGLLFIDNRAFPMFAFLFGYGMVLMINRQRQRGVSDLNIKKVLRRRSWFLILFGFIHFVFIGGADILGLYGFSGLLITWLLFKSEKIKLRTLILISFGYFIIIPLSWFGMIIYSGGAGLQEGLNPSYTYMTIVVEHSIAFPFVVLTQLLLYPMLLVILVGIWMAGEGWMDRPDKHQSKLKKFAILGIVISVIGALPLALIGIRLWDPALEWLSFAVVLHILTGIAGGLGYTALIALVSIKAQDKLPKISLTIAALGKRSLTFYIYQEGLLVLLLSPVAFGLGRYLNSTGVFLIAIIIWVTGVIFAVILERKGLSGPLDLWLRHLTYRKLK
ncbi:DUF418 domain-containing protein [Cytobacillus kochii]|uniref:DUF418 domain-containing protein n=1 Tax=Cytobacillus kochii TaxID=859143 RepID=UPI002E20F65B|nr:DUF418 domain-containing protein [Cytobacillus kochii]